MPMITLTVPEGVFPEGARTRLQKTLLATLLAWEGAPDSALFRSLSWCHIHEVPVGFFVNAEDDAPRFRLDVTVPEGAMSDRRKAGLVAQVTADIAATAEIDEANLQQIWVLVHEQPEGTWGVAGHIVRFAELRALVVGEGS
ncbi:tautomerase family protein [Gordonia sp. MP11Mi]|uniref:4-oxalocrotonate tautomerase-like domain-containing protein n=1 Tax=Gordonia sp. MP11Mi TaxID=3022769 RepID=A0AA97CZI6_9ACTN